MLAEKTTMTIKIGINGFGRISEQTGVPPGSSIEGIEVVGIQ